MAVIGNLQDIALSGLIQITCQQGDSATLHLSQAENQASIYFVKGDIVHAQLDNLTGEEAFYKLLGWEKGQFELHQGSDPAERSIFNHWSNLLLEGYSNLDEYNIEAMEYGSQNDGNHHIESEVTEFNALDEDRHKRVVWEDEGLHSIKLDFEDVGSLDETIAILKNLAEEIPGFITASVVQTDGIGLCQYNHPSEDNAALISDQTWLTMKTVEMLNHSTLSSPVNNILISSEQSTLIIEPINSHYWLGLLIRPTEPSGHARLVMQEFSPTLAATLPT